MLITTAIDKLINIPKKQIFVPRSIPAGTIDFAQQSAIGNITSQQDFHLIDSGAGFLGDFSYVRVNSWIQNSTDNTWAQITAINSNTDLTLDANIFPDNDGDGYIIGAFRDGGARVLDLSDIIDEGALLVVLKIKIKSNNINDYIWFYPVDGNTAYDGDEIHCPVADKYAYKQMLIRCNDSKIHYSASNVWDQYVYMNVIGWWK